MNVNYKVSHLRYTLFKHTYMKNDLKMVHRQDTLKNVSTRYKKVRQLLTRNGLQLLTPLKVSDSLILIAQDADNDKAQFSRKSLYLLLVHNFTDSRFYERVTLGCE